MSMQISTGYSNAYQAYNRGVATVNNAAASIAQASIEDTDPTDLSISAVDLKEGELQAKAGAKVFDIYNKTIGSLVDIKV